MGSIWLTRPMEDSLPLGERFFQDRMASLMEPLIEIKYLPSDLKPHFQDMRRAIIATSRHGLKGLILSFPTLTRATPVFCVGPATAETAKALKFKQIHCAEGDVLSLSALIGKHPLIQGFFYARGQDVSFELTPALIAQGVDAKEAVVYEAQDRQSLTPELVKKIKEGSVDQVLFYSKRTAEIFLGLVQHHGLTDQAGQMTLFCISPQIAACFDPLLFPKTICTAGPDLEQVVAAIKGSL
jgi:uroporphyrinogen-III synthase